MSELQATGEAIRCSLTTVRERIEAELQYLERASFAVPWHDCQLTAIENRSSALRAVLDWLDEAAAA